MIVSRGDGCCFRSVPVAGVFSLLVEVGESVWVGDRGPPHCDMNERTAGMRLDVSLPQPERSRLTGGRKGESVSGGTSCACPSGVEGVLTARARHGVRLSRCFCHSLVGKPRNGVSCVSRPINPWYTRPQCNLGLCYCRSCLSMDREATVVCWQEEANEREGG